MDKQQYLLDNSQIQETLFKMYYAFDTARMSILREEVFANNIELDFRALFGGEVQTLKNEDLVQYWTKMRNYCTVAQHTLALKGASNFSNILPLFPKVKQSTETACDLPDRVPVFANVLVYLRREVEGAESREAKCDATLDLELTRLSEDESTGNNPWRVSVLKANVVRQEKYAEYWTDL